MDALSRYVADAVLGIDTLWGGDVMCPSGTGRFIADSWYSDEPLPAAYTAASAAQVRETGGVGGKSVDRVAVEKYLRDVNLPAAITGVRKEAAALGGLRGQYLASMADCLETMWDLAMEILGEGPAVPYAQVADVVEDIAAAYIDLRQTADELFIDTVKRLGVEPFRERVYAAR